MGTPETIRAIRIRKNLSQLELAELSGVSRQSISKLENEHTKNPSVLTIQKIAQALGVGQYEIYLPQV